MKSTVMRLHRRNNSYQGKVVERTTGTKLRELVFLCATDRRIKETTTAVNIKNKGKAICHKSGTTLKMYNVTNTRTVFKEWWGDELGDPIAQFEGSKQESGLKQRAVGVLSWSVYRVCSCNGCLPEVPGRCSLGNSRGRPLCTC